MTEFTDLLKQFEPDNKALQPDQPKALILVVDDDESIRRGLGRVFSHKDGRLRGLYAFAAD